MAHAAPSGTADTSTGRPVASAIACIQCSTRVPPPVATILAAVTPVPDTLSEYQFAGLLRGQRVELVDCVSQPLKVPAEAEIVLEGEVSLSDYRDEGPYGDHTGYYNSVEQFPVFTVPAEATMAIACFPLRRSS